MILNTIYNENCLDTMAKMPDNFVDLTVTSPPYDNLRDYKGYSFDFEGIAKELFRVTAKGGVVVWVVGDATVDGSETGTSFRQALFFKEVGFNLHDTMIYYRQSPYPSNERYNQTFEYMFILSKEKPKTFNPIAKQQKSIKSVPKNVQSQTYRNKSGETERPNENAIKRLTLSQSNELKTSDNIWYIPSGFMVGTPDKIAFEHPAIFPEILAEQHILSWSNQSEIVYDPFMGSGTTAKMAIRNGRRYIGSEISLEYINIAEARINGTTKPLF